MRIMVNIGGFLPAMLIMVNNSSANNGDFSNNANNNE